MHKEGTHDSFPSVLLVSLGIKYYSSAMHKSRIWQFLNLELNIKDPRRKNLVHIAVTVFTNSSTI